MQDVLADTESVTAKTEQLLRQIDDTLQELRADLQPPEDFDWVAARAKWPIGQAFADIRAAVQQDVKIWATLPSTRDSYDIRPIHGGNGISVVLGENPWARIIYFTIEENHILVSIPVGSEGKTKHLLKAVPIVTDTGRYVFKVGDELLYAWQVSRKVLEGYFFDDVATTGSPG